MAPPVLSSQPTARIGTLTLGPKYLWVARVILISLLAWIVYIAPPWRYWPMWLAAAGWILFSIYWSAAAKNSTPAKDSESDRSRGIHEALVTAGQLLLFIPIPGLVQSFVPHSLAWALLGLAIEALSISLAVWARHHLGQNWSARVQIKVDHQLIRTGPYRLLRHPIYTAVLGMCIGTTLVSGQVHALVGTALAIAAYWRKLRMEESKLREAFGPQYDDYRRATWGFIPGLF
jgi:protein-S-isoprenylcysteine O-methyltransferase Ste14